MNGRREKQIHDISEFIQKAETSLEGFLKTLGWTKFEEKGSMIRCPLNSNHLVPESSLEKHLETCSWIADGYTMEEMERALPSSHFFYKNSTSVVPVLIDKERQHKILCNAAGKNPLAEDSEIQRKVPRTMERCMTELTSQERLAIYDYVVDFAKGRNKPSSVKLEDLQMNFMQAADKAEDTQPKSELELLAEERDYKRRRPTYRAKNVHITKKSYTEILKEVIQNQMQYLIESKVKSDGEDSPPCKHEPDFKRSKHHSSAPDSPDHSSSKRKRSKMSKHKHKHYDRE